MWTMMMLMMIGLQAQVDLDALRELAWSGIPSELRPCVWQLLLGYLPPNVSRRWAHVVSHWPAAASVLRRNVWGCCLEPLCVLQPWASVLHYSLRMLASTGRHPSSNHHLMRWDLTLAKSSWQGACFNSHMWKRAGDSHSWTGLRHASCRASKHLRDERSAGADPGDFCQLKVSHPERGFRPSAGQQKQPHIADICAECFCCVLCTCPVVAWCST